MPRNEQRPVRFTRHAVQRLAERNVTPAEAEAAIKAGAWHPNAGPTGGWVSRGSFGGRVLDIVFVETTDDEGRAVIEVLLVVTVIDVGRYRR